MKRMKRMKRMRRMRRGRVKERKSQRDKERKRQRDGEWKRRKAKGAFFWNINVHEFDSLKAINLFWNTKRAKCPEFNETINETIYGH